MKTDQVEGFRLSPQQKSLWLLQQEKPSLYYRTQGAIFIEGSLDKGRLIAALETVIQQQEILRTTFYQPPEITLPLQVIVDDNFCPLEDYNLQKFSYQEQLAELEAIFQKMLQRPFDLEKYPLWHLSLVQLSVDQHWLILSLPGLGADRFSLTYLMGEISHFYAATTWENPEDIPLQYIDFSQWQNELLEVEETADGRAFWQQRDLSNNVPLILPLERKNAQSSPSDFQPRWVSLTLSADEVQKIKKAAEKCQISPRIFLLTCFIILLGRMTNRSEVYLGVGFQGRQYEELARSLGLMAKDLPMSADLDPTIQFKPLCQKIAQEFQELAKWQDYFTGKNQDSSWNIIGFEADLETEKKLTQSRIDWSLTKSFSCLHPYQLKVCALKYSSQIDIEFHYNANCFQEEVIEGWLGQYYTLLTSAIANISSPIGKLDILSDEEKKQILFQFNPSLEARSQENRFKYQCIHRIFEEQVKRTPDQIAVIGEGEKLTYRQLNTRANQLACRLRQLGVHPDDRVGIFLERSPLLIVAFMGVLKAGGAYVPLDPVLPKERLEFMIEDSQAQIVLTQRSLTDQLPSYSGKIVDLETDWPTIEQHSRENLITEVSPENLVYAIYTSGSTGNPKGVAIEHRQLLNYLQGITERLNLPPQSSYALISTFGADLGNTVIFPALCSGGCLHIISQENSTDSVALGAYFEQQGGIDCLKIVPSHLQVLLRNTAHPAQILPRKRLVLGGETLSWELVEQVRKLAPNCQILNHYGPTESTVGVLTYGVEKDCRDMGSVTVPLGRPLPNTQIFLLDGQLRPVPIGFPGELYIGGSNLARGYLNQSHLTQERFGINPFNQQLKLKVNNQRLKIKITRGQWFNREAKFKFKSEDRNSYPYTKHKLTLSERLYRTGDLARYLPDGNIEFLGRIDHQVKLHGFRIELGEIETKLKTHPLVAETVVIVWGEQTEEKRLVAYVIPTTNIKLTYQELRGHLQKILPEFMIPSTLVILERLPLTPNGKLDRRALPAPDSASLNLEASYIAPRTTQEKILAEIWAGVLNLPQVGIEDNFFELGGDSILSIQIVARAKAAGIVLKPIQLFHHQTIAELTTTSQNNRAFIQFGEVTGKVPLTPIQHWFFQQHLPKPDHWNMSILVKTPPKLQRITLEKIIKSLIEHHDALRLSFKLKESGWEQHYGEVLNSEIYLYIDLSLLAQTEIEERIKAESTKIQSSLNLTTPPLMRVAWFDLGQDKPGRLLVVMHHLLMDGISWRIWLEDFQTAYTQLERGEVIQLPSKTTSFKYWSEKLNSEAFLKTFVPELDYWVNQSQTSVSLPQELNKGFNTFSSARTVSISLNTTDTQAVLQQVPRICQTQINDVLLTALLQAFTTWTGKNYLLVELEGHGRESLFDDVDISRTLGWFTTHFPLMLQWVPSDSTLTVLQSIKEQLGTCPHRGIGYGLLRYLSHPEITKKLENLPQPQVCFNYLGQFFQGLTQFPLIQGNRGEEKSGSSLRTHEITIDVMVIDGQMQFEWTYSSNHHQQKTIEKLAGDFVNALKKIIHDCLKMEGKPYKISDFPLANLTEQQLEQLARKFDNIVDIYPVSPLQQGILFHSLYTPESNLYCQQKVFTLEGELNISAFKEAWHIVINRHASLKTAFVWENLDIPLQVVQQEITLPWYEKNCRDLSSSEQKEQLEIYLKADLERGFLLSETPLMRMALWQIAKNRYELIWSHHHLLLDGWCNSIIFKEVFTLYEALSEHREIVMPPSPFYRDYIAWLHRQDWSEAAAFWHQSLKGIKAATRWGIEQSNKKGIGEKREYAYEQLQLSQQTSANLNIFARTHHLTLNTLIQGCFALLLSRYSGEENVIFGSTVSGRPPELEGVESMVGLLINTLPVRMQVCSDIHLLEWFKQIQQQQIQRLEYQYNSLVQIQQWSDVPSGLPLFESFIAVENYPVDRSLLDGSLKILQVRSFSRTNYPLSVTIELDTTLLIAIAYDPEIFEEVAIRRLFEQWQTLMENIHIYATEKLSVISLTPMDETQNIIDSFNADLD